MYLFGLLTKRHHSVTHRSCHRGPSFCNPQDTSSCVHLRRDYLNSRLIFRPSRQIRSSSSLFFFISSAYLSTSYFCCGLRFSTFEPHRQIQGLLAFGHLSEFNFILYQIFICPSALYSWLRYLCEVRASSPCIKAFIGCAIKCFSASSFISQLHPLIFIL